MLLDMPTPISPIPFVQKLISQIWECSTPEALDTLKASDRFRADYRCLGTVDQATVVDAGVRRRAIVTPTAPTPIEVIEVPATGSAPMRAGEVPLGSRDENSPESQNVRRNARVRQAPTRGQTAGAIATAVAATRAGVTSRLAGVYASADGQLGTIVSFGACDETHDLISSRYRQVKIPYRDVVTALTTAGLDAALLGDSVSQIAHFGDSCRILNNSGYVARRVKNPPLGQNISAQYLIGVVNADKDAQNLGSRAVVITLHHDGSATQDRTWSLADQIVADYLTRVTEDLILSDDLLERIKRALRDRYSARYADCGLYVPPGRAADVRKFLDAISPVAGRQIYTFVPREIDADQIAKGLSTVFEKDLQKLETELEEKSEIRKLAGATLIERVETLRLHAVGLASLLGQGTSDAYLARLRVADAKVTGALDATASRFANLELS